MFDKINKKTKRIIASILLVVSFFTCGAITGKKVIDNKSKVAIETLVEAEKNIPEGINKELELQINAEAVEAIENFENDNYTAVEYENYKEKTSTYLNAAKLAILNSSIENSGISEEFFEGLGVENVTILLENEHKISGSPYTGFIDEEDYEQGWHADIYNPKFDKMIRVYFENDSVIAKYVSAVIEYENTFDIPFLKRNINNNKVSNVDLEIILWRERKVALKLAQLLDCGVSIDVHEEKSTEKQKCFVLSETK